MHARSRAQFLRCPLNGTIHTPHSTFHTFHIPHSYMAHSTFYIPYSTHPTVHILALHIPGAEETVPWGAPEGFSGVPIISSTVSPFFVTALGFPPFATKYCIVILALHAKFDLAIQYLLVKPAHVLMHSKNLLASWNNLVFLSSSERKGMNVTGCD